MAGARARAGIITVEPLRVQVTTESVLTVKRIFELANRAHFLYFTRNRGQLLKSVLLNCGTEGVNLWPVYRKPFDVIFERAKNKNGGEYWLSISRSSFNGLGAPNES
jgi:hypothetical protein